MEKNEKELVIPENCLPVEYLIMGFTMYDILAIGICVVIGSVVALSVYHRTHNSMIAVAVIFAVAIVAIYLIKYGLLYFIKRHRKIIYMNM